MPVAGGDEGGPVERMGTQAMCPSAVDHLDVGVSHGVGRAEVLLKAAFVQRPHPLSRGDIVNGPETHDDGAHSGDLERAAQAEDAFSGLDLPDAGVARRQDGPFRALQVERA